MTKIQWTDDTWNPVTGCTKVSPGCDHCYMYRGYPRLRGMHVPGYEVGPEFVQVLPDRLDKPYHYKPGTKIFVCSMSDLFHPRVPWDFIVKVFDVMACVDWVTFQVLTKRPGRMAYFANEIWPKQGGRWDPVKPITNNRWPGTKWPMNVWAGTSVESAKYLPRLNVLARVPAKVRFVSCEPILGALDLWPWICPRDDHKRPGQEPVLRTSTGGSYRMIDWVIAGGESGPGARPIHPEWIRDLQRQCALASVPFFFKQWGDWRPAVGMTLGTTARWKAITNEGVFTDYLAPGTEIMAKVGTKAAGAMLDGRELMEFP